MVRLPAGLATSDVEDALRMAGAIEVLSVAATSSGQDPLVRALESALRVLTSPRDAALIGPALARMAYADEGALVPRADAVRFALARRALATGVPAAGRAAPDASPLGVPTGWVLWVALDGATPGLAVVARRLNVRFSAAEAARLRAFGTLRTCVGGSSRVQGLPVPARQPSAVLADRR